MARLCQAANAAKFVIQPSHYFSNMWYTAMNMFLSPVGKIAWLDALRTNSTPPLSGAGFA